MFTNTHVWDYSLSHNPAIHICVIWCNLSAALLSFLNKWNNNKVSIAFCPSRNIKFVENPLRRPEGLWRNKRIIGQGLKVHYCDTESACGDTSLLSRKNNDDTIHSNIVIITQSKLNLIGKGPHSILSTPTLYHQIPEDTEVVSWSAICTEVFTLTCFRLCRFKFD